jgi:uncharacterized protein YfaS (alpha-2-macroglobulin family)
MVIQFQIVKFESQDKTNFELIEVKEKTNDNGITIFNLKTFDNIFLIAEKENDIALLQDISISNLPNNCFISHVFDDRKLYKPNEVIHIKGYIRELCRFDENNSFSKLSINNLKGKDIDYTIYDGTNCNI